MAQGTPPWGTRSCYRILPGKPRLSEGGGHITAPQGLTTTTTPRPVPAL